MLFLLHFKSEVQVFHIWHKKILLSFKPTQANSEKKCFMTTQFCDQLLPSYSLLNCLVFIIIID